MRNYFSPMTQEQNISLTVHNELEKKVKILHTIDDLGLSSNQPYQSPG